MNGNRVVRVSMHVLERVAAGVEEGVEMAVLEVSTHLVDKRRQHDEKHDVRVHALACVDGTPSNVAERGLGRQRVE